METPRAVDAARAVAFEPNDATAERDRPATRADTCWSVNHVACCASPVPSALGHGAWPGPAKGPDGRSGPPALS